MNIDMNMDIYMYIWIGIYIYIYQLGLSSPSHHCPGWAAGVDRLSLLLQEGEEDNFGNNTFTHAPRNTQSPPLVHHTTSSGVGDHPV